LSYIPSPWFSETQSLYVAGAGFELAVLLRLGSNSRSSSFSLHIKELKHHLAGGD
jgi:hypothetical protein